MTLFRARHALHQLKENDGKAARTALLRLIVYFVCAQVILVLIYLMVRVEEGPPRVQHMRVGKGLFNGEDPHERAVLEAKYFLIELKIPPGALDGEDDMYEGVMGTFCPLDWHLQKSNPSTVSMFRDLVAKSTHCQKHSISLPLQRVVEQVQKHDAAHGLVHPLHQSGIVFHETRCGSTLVANLLVGADPVAHRVYSESAPLLQAMQACASSRRDCNEEARSSLIRDTLYLMSRSSDPREKRVFFKIQSVGLRHMSVLLDSLEEEVPWIFVYRDSLEVIMSHFKDRGGGKVCLRGRNRPHFTIQEIVESKNRDMDSLSKYEYCAAHLASLCETAIARGQVDETGHFVNYNSLPESMWETVLPDYFGVSLSSHHVEGIQKAAGVYSKGRGDKANQEWTEDSSRKQEKASAEMRQAVATFLEPSYARLQELS